MVAGAQLLPLSCYHLAGLSLFNSPFCFDHPKNITPADLRLAVLICSYGFLDGPEHLFPSPDKKEIGAISRKMRFASDLARFLQYFNDYTTLPEMWSDEKRFRASAVPTPFFIVATNIAAYSGISEQEAWDMPYSRAVCYKMIQDEKHGGQFRTEHERRMQELADEADRKSREAANG